MAETAEQRAVFRRAVEAAVWGMPAVNFRMMLAAAQGVAGPGSNRIIYWSRLMDWRNQTLTPNPDTIYVMPFIDTHDGPMVLEIPAATATASITGSIDDLWQSPLEDVGPAGADQGRCGRYLILPPGDQSPVPDDYIVLPALTYASYALLRSNLHSGSPDAVSAAVEYARTIKLYPLAVSEEPPATSFVDVVDELFDATIPYDGRFFRELAVVVETDPWLLRDKSMIDTLRTIGIEKGIAFDPDPDTAAILDRAIVEAQEFLDHRYETGLGVPFADTARWALPATRELIQGMSSLFADPDSYPVDARGVGYSYAFFSAKHLGAGQFYLVTATDGSGEPFEGGARYRLTVPADAPVDLYWSATVYDRATHALIRDRPHASCGSNSPGLATSADGSCLIEFGPTPPAAPEQNWIPTAAGRRFEIVFRFYGPTKPLFDKTWRLPDVESL